jgi:hypothetical protein
MFYIPTFCYIFIIIIYIIEKRVFIFGSIFILKVFVVLKNVSDFGSVSGFGSVRY